MGGLIVTEFLLYMHPSHYLRLLLAQKLDVLPLLLLFHLLYIVEAKELFFSSMHVFVLEGLHDFGEFDVLGKLFVDLRIVLLCEILGCLDEGEGVQIFIDFFELDVFHQMVELLVVLARGQ